MRCVQLDVADGIVCFGTEDGSHILVHESQTDPHAVVEYDVRPARRGIETRIEAVLHLRQSLYAEIVRARESGLWRDRNWVLIEATYTADDATVLVSEDDAASLELEGAATALTGPSLQLADASAGLSVRSQTGRIAQVLAARNVALLYSCVRIKTALWGTKRVVRGGEPLTKDPTQEADVLVPVDLSELHAS